MPHRAPPLFRIRSYRNGLRIAVVVAVLVHALILALVVLPTPHQQRERTRLIVIPERFAVAPPIEELTEVPQDNRAEAPEPGATASRRPADALAPSVPIPTPAVGPPEAETIPRTGLTRLHAPTLPLIVTPYGIGRRPVVRDEARIARMRAESLVNAMIASVVEVKPPLKAGPLTFPEGGGVSIPIPWGGFVRDDREDAAWREERCRGEEKEKADKPGEEEARRSQCG